MAEEGFAVEVRINDGITSGLRKLIQRLPKFRESLQSQYTRQAKDVIVEILNREFGTDNRLSKGTVIRETKGTSFIEIKATGKKDTRGAERLAIILNEGHPPHPIFPRKKGGVLAMDKGPEGIVFRKFVRAHAIRGRHFMESARDALERMFKARAKIDVKQIKEMRK